MYNRAFLLCVFYLRKGAELPYMHLHNVGGWEARGLRPRDTSLGR